MQQKQLISLTLACLVSAGLMPLALADSALNEGIALYNKRDFQQAIKSLDKSIKANPLSPTPLYYEALSYYQLGNTTKAKSLYTSIYYSFPHSEEAKYAATYLQRVDPKFVNLLGSPTAQRTTITTTTTTTTTSTANTAAVAAPMGDMTTFAAANATADDLSKLPDQGSVPFSRGKDGHLFVNTTINGRTVQMMFDTGASTCLIGKNQLEAAGVFDNVIKGQTTQMGGVGNKVNNAAPMLVNLGVGNIQRHMPIMVQDRFDLPPLLGQTFYNGYQYDIDNAGGVIRFTKKSLARNNQGYDTVEVPFEIVGNNLVVMAEVNGHRCPMYFDTGAGLILFGYGAFSSLGLSIPSDASMVMVGGVGGSVPAYTFNVSSMRLGSIQKNNVPVCVATTGGPPLPLLGQPFFKDRRFTIDNDRHVIRFSR